MPKATEVPSVTAGAAAPRLLRERVIVFGSRGYPRLKLVRERVERLPREVVVVVGGAAGPDKTAQRTAERAGMEVELHRALWETDGKRAGHIRNDLMGSLGAALAIGFWDGQSRGTAGMIGVCKRHAIPLEIWDEDGTLTTGEDATLRLWRDLH